MIHKRVWPLAMMLVVWLAGAVSLFSQEGLQFFPLSQVQPGLKGVGKTVFEGDKIEEFQVQILGVLRNAMAPKRDIILARLSGGPLEKTGVIAGMSGSPVYIDGKLLGAVALSFPFSKEPLAGITPIEDMMQVVPAPLPAAPQAKPAASIRFTRIPGSSDIGRLIPEDEDVLENLTALISPASSAGEIAGLRLPARFGGFPNEVVQAHASFFRNLGLEPMQSAVLAGGQDKTLSKTDLTPGSMISLLLVRGDLNLNVDCTVTYRKGDNLYACGHRFLMVGPTKIPFAPSHVITAVANLASSFKLDVPGQVVGSITQDRFGAIYGTIGEKSPQIPVHIRLQSSLNVPAEYNFELTENQFLTPLLLNLSTIATLNATERSVGPSTMEVKGRIRLANNDFIEIEDVISGDIGTANIVAGTLAAPLALLLNSSFSDLRVEGIDLAVTSSNEKRIATIEQVWSSKSEVMPGDKIEITVVLRTPAGESIVQKLPVEIPESTNDRSLSLIVGSGSAINALQSKLLAPNFSPRDLKQLVQAINKMRRNNRLYALLMAPQRSFVLQGDEYPSPPPSLVQTFLADPAVSSSVSFSGTSVVGDFETKPIHMNIRGQKALFLKVVDQGK